MRKTDEKPNETVTDDDTEEKLRKKKTKRTVVIVSAAAFTTILATAGIIIAKNRKPAEYSDKWFAAIPYDDLKGMRDKIWDQWSAHNTNDEYRERLWAIMKRFDKEISDRWPEPSVKLPPRHRDGGWYLLEK